MENIQSWTVFFMFEPLTTIHTTVLTYGDEYEESDIIKMAHQKILKELCLDVYALAERLGKNDNFGGGWISVECNLEATEKEIELLTVNDPL